MNFTDLSPEAAASYSKLRDILSNIDKAAVACSGGIDSTLLLHAASGIPGLDITAFTVKSLFIPLEDISEAADQAASLNIRHIIIDVDVNKIPEIKKNPPLRCYYCKKEVFSAIISEAEARGITTILEGSHHDDSNDYRPGIKALDELGVRSPLKEAGFTKKQIREVSRYLHIGAWNRPSSPCLATRIPYDTEITEEIIKTVYESEKFIKSLGFTQLRVRIHGNLARIEIEEKDTGKILDTSARTAIELCLKNLGFEYITLDLRGYRAGSMNIGINREEN